MTKLVGVEGHKNLKRDVQTGIYYVWKFKSGKGRLRESLGTTSVAEAKREADRRVAEWLVGQRQHLARVPLTRAVCDELGEYLDKLYAQGERRLVTHKKDAVYLKQIMTRLGHIKITELDEDFWEAWVTQEGRSSGQTLFDFSKYLSKVLSFAHRRKYIQRKPSIRNPDPARETSRRVLSQKEINALNKAADGAGALYLALCYECGLRTSEARQARFSWFKEQDGRLTLTLPAWAVKANARSISLGDTPSKLVRFARLNTSSDFLFPGFGGDAPETLKSACKRFAKLCVKAKVKKCTLYDLRHTFFTRLLLEQGAAVQTVAMYGGTSIQMLQKHYLHGSAENTASIANKLTISGGKREKRSRK